MTQQNQQLVGDQLQGTPPTSPADAKAKGANPDEAKMGGSSAAKKAALKTPQQSLARTKRITPAKAPGVDQAGTEARAAADRLAQVGALGSRLDAKIKSYMTTAVTQPEVTAGVDTEALDAAFEWTDKEVQKPKIESALTAFLNSETKSEEDLNVLAAAFTDAGMDGSKVYQPGYLNSLYRGVGDILGEAGKLQTEQFTIGSVGLFEDPNEAQSIADTLGVTVEELNAMTPEDLDDLVSEKESEGFSQIETLKAELRTASPLRQQQIIEQLRGLGESGVETADIQADQAVADIEAGTKLTYKGEQIALKDLLSDDLVSEDIRLALADEGYLAKLAETEPELAAWISTNKELLEATQERVDQASAKGLKVQQDFQEFLETVPEALQGIFLGDLPENATAAQVEAWREQLNSDPMYQATQENPGFGEWLQNNPELIDQIRLEDGSPSPGLVEFLGESGEDLQSFMDKDPEFLSKIRDLEPKQIRNALAATDALNKSLSKEGGIYGGILDDLVGLSSGNFVLDPAKADQILQVSEDLLSMDSEIYEDEDFLPLLKSGDFTLDDLATLSKYPETYREIKEAAATKKFLKGNPNDQQMIDYIFGKKPKMNVSHIESLMSGSSSRLTAEAKKMGAELRKRLGSDFRKKWSKIGKEDDAGRKELLKEGLAGLLEAGTDSSSILSSANKKNKGNYKTGVDVIRDLDKGITSLFTKAVKKADPQKAANKSFTKAWNTAMDANPKLHTDNLFSISGSDLSGDDVGVLYDQLGQLYQWLESPNNKNKKYERKAKLRIVFQLQKLEKEWKEEEDAKKARSDAEKRLNVREKLAIIRNSRRIP